MTSRRTSLWRSCQPSVMARFICTDCWHRARDAGIAVTATTQALADVAAISDTLPDQMLANTGVQIFLHMRDREADWAASVLGRGETEQQSWSEDADGGVVRRWRRPTTGALVPPRVLEGFGVGDAVLAVAATVTRTERRLERFRVALPTFATESYPVTWRWKTHVLTFAAGALAAAALVLSSSCLTGREGADQIEYTRHRSLRANAALGRRLTRGIPAAVAEWLSSSVARAPQLSFLRPDRPLLGIPVAGSWKPE